MKKTFEREVEMRIAQFILESPDKQIHPRELVEAKDEIFKGLRHDDGREFSNTDDAVIMLVHDLMYISVQILQRTGSGRVEVNPKWWEIISEQEKEES